MNQLTKTARDNVIMRIEITDNNDDFIAFACGVVFAVLTIAFFL